MINRINFSVSPVVGFSQCCLPYQGFGMVLTKIPNSCYKCLFILSSFSKNEKTFFLLFFFLFLCLILTPIFFLVLELLVLSECFFSLQS